MLKQRIAASGLALLLVGVVNSAPDLCINDERLVHAVQRMQRASDSASPRSLSSAKRNALRLIARRMRAAGMMTHVDDAGNLVGRVRGTRPLPPILIGSQIDAGDGQGSPAAAILAAIEVQQTLHDAGRVLNHPLEIVAWSNPSDDHGESRPLPDALPIAARARSACAGRTVARGMRILDGDPSRLTDVQRRPGDIAAHLELVVVQENFEEFASGAANRLLQKLLELDSAP